MPSPVIVSQGDIAGAGWQLFCRDILKERPKSCIIIVGDKTEADMGGVKFASEISGIDFRDKSYFLFHRNKLIQSKPGIPTKQTSLASYENFIRSLKVWRSVTNSALLTLPVSKEMIIKAGKNFQGHTEVIGKEYKRKTFLCMYSKQLTTVLLTNHIPLKKVSSALKKVDYEQLIGSLRKFRNLLGIKKPVAMLGLNPHAGEGGKIGDEEIFLKEKIREMCKKGLKTEGPFSADSFFMNNYYENFSISLACYHDQGLIPFKALAGLKGVNVTLGVPQLRVSPDHGTAYKSIRNNEKLSSDGIKSALNFAIKWGQKWAQL